MIKAFFRKAINFFAIYFYPPVTGKILLVQLERCDQTCFGVTNTADTAHFYRCRQKRRCDPLDRNADQKIKPKLKIWSALLLYHFTGHQLGCVCKTSNILSLVGGATVQHSQLRQKSTIGLEVNSTRQKENAF